MPIQYIHDELLSLVFFMVDGKLTVSDLVRHHYSTSGNIDYHPGLRLIYDITRAEIEFSLEDLYTNHRITEQEFEQRGYLLPVAIISNNSVATLVSKTIHLFGSRLPLKLAAFSTLADALSWLNMATELSEVEQLQKKLAIMDKNK